MTELGRGIGVLLGLNQEVDDLPVYRVAQLSKELGQDFRRLVLRSLGKKRKELERYSLRLGEYDAGYVPGAHEVRWVKVSENNDLRDFFASVPAPGDAAVFGPDRDEVADVRFFIVTTIDQQKHLIHCFRTITPSKKLARTNAVWAHFVGDKFQRIEDVSIAFEPEFQAIFYEGYLFIFQQFGFETLFQFYSDLKTSAQETLDKIQTLVPIANFEKLREDSMQHLVKIRKLRNISRTSYLTELDMKKIKATIKEFDVKVKVVKEDGQEKLLYDRKNPWDLFELLEDQFVKSTTTGKKYAANSKREIVAKKGTE